ncbi:AAA family ATPase [Clostridium sp. 'deep sea']|uniref:ATP-dependent nuclease n=1 Tax=Clostridium sp. 'deep sea' TaxID=2779445 RepID=UPI0018967C74|nr:AAA family ATPase [Clostridium sp. 'deep sea']QOR34830.1 AAA family ATPase [Clostridium sp. 'deep sea']
MSKIRINGIQVKNYRSFGDIKSIIFPDDNYKKPISIVGYNNSGKTNLLNAILYGITAKHINKNTFTIDDFHNRDYSRIPYIVTGISSSKETKENGKFANLAGYHYLIIKLDGSEIESAKIESYNSKKEINYTAYGASKYYKIFYINFHEIKNEMNTKKTSWGNLSSFLAKHIKYIVDTDQEMISKKNDFQEEIKKSTKNILKDSLLKSFIDKVQTNYSKNLRNNNCNIDFSLPAYEDIFLDMIFKIGLNGDTENLIPISHFGDGYISMFVMAIIQAIAETSKDDKCLFLFEEPESFLHENHQEYFYKTVLCGLSENGHQVIYTTHSDKMIDIFDTKGLIRLEFDEGKRQTEVTYNNAKGNFDDLHEKDEFLNEINDFNNYIKIIKPSLNKIIFSRKVLLVEGPNDIMVYNHIIQSKVLSITKDKKYAETYLNFNNISIIPHYGKITALVLIRLCKHLGIDYFVVNDLDFSNNIINKLNFKTEEELKASNFYINKIEELEEYNNKGAKRSPTTNKGMITTNWKLINEAGKDNIHFNIPKLEDVIGYESNDKNSVGVWNTINKLTSFGIEIFPKNLENFLELDNIKINEPNDKK